MARKLTPIRAIRAKCLDCACNSIKYIRYCPCDGLHADRCPLWPFRFGLLPKTAAKKYGAELLDPQQMPDGKLPLEQCSPTSQ
jgi:hypothetical protein